jgi:hypothetical protein
VHVVKHAVLLALQARSPHDIVVAAGQLPAPSHPEGKVSVPLVQLADRQLVSMPGKVHELGDAVVHEPMQGGVPVQGPRFP